MDYKPKIKIIHICLSTSKETTSEKFLIYNAQIMTSKICRLCLYTTSYKPHRVLCETKDHLHSTVTPIFDRCVCHNFPFQGAKISKNRLRLTLKM